MRIDDLFSIALLRHYGVRWVNRVYRVDWVNRVRWVYGAIGSIESDAKDPIDAKNSTELPLRDTGIRKDNRIFIGITVGGFERYALARLVEHHPDQRLGRSASGCGWKRIVKASVR